MTIPQDRASTREGRATPGNATGHVLPGGSRGEPPPGRELAHAGPRRRRMLGLIVPHLPLRRSPVGNRARYTESPGSLSLSFWRYPTPTEGNTMARPRLPIAPHLTPAAIARRDRSCRTGVETTHWQILWLLTRCATPPTPAAIASPVGLTPAWVRTVLKRWNTEGPNGPADRRVATNGGQPKLTAEPRAEWDAARQRPPSDGGLWTGPKVAVDVRGRWGVTVCAPTAWEWWRALGWSLQVPRPRNPKAATADEQRAGKRRHGSWDCRAAPATPRSAGRGPGRG
jgi:transposase